MSFNKLRLCLIILSSYTELLLPKVLLYITVADCGFGTVVFSRSSKKHF